VRHLVGLQCSAAFNRLSISARLILLVLALALPLNLLIVGVIWGLVQRANEVQHTSLLYAAWCRRRLGKYVALAETLSRSPALLDENLDAFEAESRRAFPTGGGAGALVADADGQQLLNPFAEPGRPCHGAIRWRLRSPLSTIPAGIIVPTFPRRSPPRLFDRSSSRWLGISDLIAEPEGPPSSSVQLRSAVWTGDARHTRPEAELAYRRLFAAQHSPRGRML
jgi:hypothetical protein